MGTPRSSIFMGFSPYKPTSYGGTPHGPTAKDGEQRGPSVSLHSIKVTRRWRSNLAHRLPWEVLHRGRQEEGKIGIPYLKIPHLSNGHVYIYIYICVCVCAIFDRVFQKHHHNLTYPMKKSTFIHIRKRLFQQWKTSIYIIYRGCSTAAVDYCWRTDTGLISIGVYIPICEQRPDDKRVLPMENPNFLQWAGDSNVASY